MAIEATDEGGEQPGQKHPRTYSVRLQTTRLGRGSSRGRRLSFRGKFSTSEAYNCLVKVNSLIPRSWRELDVSEG